MNVAGDFNHKLAENEEEKVADKKDKPRAMGDASAAIEKMREIA